MLDPIVPRLSKKKQTQTFRLKCATLRTTQFSQNKIKRRRILTTSRCLKQRFLGRMPLSGALSSIRDATFKRVVGREDHRWARQGGRGRHSWNTHKTSWAYTPPQIVLPLSSLPPSPSLGLALVGNDAVKHASDGMSYTTRESSLLFFRFIFLAETETVVELDLIVCASAKGG